MEKDIRQSFPFFTGKRKIVAIFTVLALALVGWLIFKNNTQKIQYQTARVERGKMVSSISVSGQVSSTNSQAVTTSATGIVKNIFVKNGDRVERGSPIAKITLDFAAEQRQAKALADYLSTKNAVDAANAMLYTLQSKMFAANQKFINDRGVANPSVEQKADPVYIQENADWLAAEANYKNQQNVIAAAQATMNNSYLTYLQNQATVLAPASGTVVDLTIINGASIVKESVADSSQITNFQSSWRIAGIKNNIASTVTVSLSEIDAPRVRLGNKATLTFDAFPGKIFTGRVAGINTAGIISSGVTNYPATIVLNKEVANIFSDMSASADIIIAEKEESLIIPSVAVQMQKDQSFVRVLKDKKVEEIPVKVGISSDTQMEVVSGLNEGEEVIMGIANLRQNNAEQNFSPFRTGVLRPGGFGGGRGGR